MRKGVMMILKKMMVMTLVVAMVASNLQVVSAVDENAEVIPTAETKSGESTVKTLELYVNGIKSEAGITISKDDEVQIVMDIVGNPETTMAAVELATSLDIVDNYSKVSLTYDESLSRYVASLDIANLYDTEWGIFRASVQDVDGNFEVINLSNFATYFYVKNGEVCEVPEHYLAASFWATDVEGICYEDDEAHIYTQTEIVTSWKELMPQGLPTPRTPAGSRFIGWVCNGEIINYGDEFLVTLSTEGQSVQEYSCFALYDINYAVVRFDGVFGNGATQYEQVVTWKQGDTYQSIINQLDLSIEHYEGLKVQELDYSGILNGHELTDEIDLGDDSTFYGWSVDVKYDKPVAILNYSYIDSRIESCDERVIYVLEPGATYADVKNLFMKKEIAHNEQLTFLDWSGFESDSKVITGTQELFVSPMYKESIVTVDMFYMEPDSEEITRKELSFIYTDTLTFRDVLECANNTKVEHTPDKVFVSWKIASYDGIEMDLDLDNKREYEEFWDICVEAVYQEKNEIPNGGVTEELPPTVIEDKVDAIESAKDGDTIEVEMKTEDGKVATQVPEEILEAAKGKDVDVVLDMGDYSWTINGEDITAEELKDINLEVTQNTNVVDKSVVDKLAKGDKSMQISLTHNGEFGFKATLTLNLGKDNAGKFGNLYYFKDGKELVFQGAGKIDKDGNVSLGFDHASDYVIYIGSERTNIPEKGDNNALPFLVFAMGAMLVAAGVSKKRFAR